MPKIQQQKNIKCTKKCMKGTKSAKKCGGKVPKISVFLALSGIFFKHIQILFVAVTQCNKQKICLLQ